MKASPKPKDQYVCPHGQILPLHSRCSTEEVILYRAIASVCNGCPLKTECTGSKSGRHIFRSFFQEYLDRVEAYRQTEANKKAMRKRGVWIEPLFGEAKEFHGLRRFRLRSLFKECDLPVYSILIVSFWWKWGVLNKLITFSP